MNFILNFSLAGIRGALSGNNFIALLLIFFILSYGMNVIFPQFNSQDFQDLVLDITAQDNARGNIINQVYWLFLFFLAMFAVLRNPKPFKNLVYSNYAILIFTGFVILSVLWSDVPFITIRRAVQFTIIIFSIAVAVAYVKSPHHILIVFYKVAGLALILNLIALTLGVGFDQDGYFKGIHGHKNTLGPVAVISIYAGLAMKHLRNCQDKSMIINVFLSVWFFMLVISVSKTSILLLFACPLIALIMFKASLFLKISMGGLLFYGLIVVVTFFILILILTGLTVQEFLGMFIADPSFTGRDVIWLFMVEYLKDDFFLGYGYGGFWGAGFSSPNVKYGFGFITLLNQAHNGYIDLIANLGIVGGGIYLMVLRKFSINVEYLKSDFPKLVILSWAILIFTLIHNFTESSIARGYSLLWLLQVILFFMMSRYKMDSYSKGKKYGA